VRQEAKVTSKGQVTVPLPIRHLLGVRTGDKLVFESDAAGVRVSAWRKKSPFEKYRGIGTSGIGSGRGAVIGWVRRLRGR